MESDVLLDRRLAFAFLRITLGLNIPMHEAVRLPILSVFVAGLMKEFAKTLLKRYTINPSGLWGIYNLHSSFLITFIGDGSWPDTLLHSFTSAPDLRESRSISS